VSQFRLQFRLLRQCRFPWRALGLRFLAKFLWFLPFSGLLEGAEAPRFAAPGGRISSVELTTDLRLFGGLLLCSGIVNSQ
jgi:hypothetical protein